MEDYTLSIPLLTTPATATDGAENGVSSATTSSIICRLLLVILIGTISVWANHEASKGFKVTIVNNPTVEVSPAGRRFHLFYVSNDEATRIILNTSAVVEKILYPNQPHQTKKPIHHVVLQLAAAGDNTSTNKVSVVNMSKGKESVYVISLSPWIMEESNVKYSVISAIQRAMARIWLWDGESSGAPPWLIDGMVEYIWTRIGFGHRDEETTLHLESNIRGEQFCSVLSRVCSKSKMNTSAQCGGRREWAESSGVCREDDEDPKFVAGVLGYLEKRHKGFVQGLNRIMRDGWEGGIEVSTRYLNYYSIITPLL
ncbi:Carbohydrate-binding X8 domain superfamily protein, putative isoform 1 [Hibiscus syriacus]|uniref:Carbohydrate-binding X8 domain superfamily protein, putative isoform 1 n=1 Tax=Hibiscus syriacus TaxID=106335 RepID=A0A6A2YCQ5_HIBSY|nr:Carbohydrate-binding X8 domain superfamily protein, putative isoform 1 [Hibiscus syriacus]